jgi:hypothetical protein
MAEGIDAIQLAGEAKLSTPRMSPDANIGQRPINPEKKEQESLKVNFTINNRYLIAQTLSGIRQDRYHSSGYKDDLIALENKAKENFPRCYEFVSGWSTPEVFFAQRGTIDELSDYLEQIEQSSEFKKIRQQTEESLQRVKEQWEKNYSQTSQIIENITGLDLNKEVTVLMTHPDLLNGMYLGNNTLAWSHREDWPNYSTVYLWHEIMHSYFDRTDLSHALIEFVTDNELRTQLNQGETYPPFVGHENLFLLEEKILPHWRNYLTEVTKNGKRDIRVFQEKLKEMFQITG